MSVLPHRFQDSSEQVLGAWKFFLDSNVAADFVETRDPASVGQALAGRERAGSENWLATWSPVNEIVRRSRENAHARSIELQISELRDDAIEGNACFNEASAGRLIKFCNDLAADYEPAIFRIANGNLRALWQDEKKDQIGIQFFDDGQIQFVILRDRVGRTCKTLGVEDAVTIKQLVAVLRLNRLWFHG